MAIRHKLAHKLNLFSILSEQPVLDDQMLWLDQTFLIRFIIILLIFS